MMGCLHVTNAEEKLKDVPPKSIVLLETPVRENQMKLIASFVKSRPNDKAIFISSNRPTNDLVEKLLTEP